MMPGVSWTQYDVVVGGFITLEIDGMAVSYFRYTYISMG